MANWMDELVRGGTLCLSKAGLAIGSDTTMAKTAAPNGAGIDYAIKGIAYHKADTDDLFDLENNAVQTALYSCIYLCQLNAAGTASTVQGAEVLTADVAAGRKPLEWPEPDADNCPVGAIRVDAGASAFTPQTTALTGGTVTVTYYDFMAVPPTPLVS